MSQAKRQRLENPTIGYHKIRGLGAPLRMMCYYKSQNFVNVAYGSDFKKSWFADDKPQLQEKNSCMNLPYIIDGDQVVTQSNTCALYLGKKLGIDDEDDFFHNHTVLDQVMDWRNDLMKIVYPFGGVKTEKQFPAAAKEHIKSATTTHLQKLDQFCKGIYMCGGSPQSGDFCLFEMLDQHVILCEKLGLDNVLDDFPKMKVLHAATKQSPALVPYFKSKYYEDWAHNNGLFTHFTGQGADFVYGGTVEERITF